MPITCLSSTKVCTVVSDVNASSQQKFPFSLSDSTHTAEGQQFWMGGSKLFSRTVFIPVLQTRWGGEHGSLVLFVCTGNTGNLGGGEQQS